MNRNVLFEGIGRKSLGLFKMDAPPLVRWRDRNMEWVFTVFGPLSSIVYAECFDQSDYIMAKLMDCKIAFTLAKTYSWLAVDKFMWQLWRSTLLYLSKYKILAIYCNRWKLMRFIRKKNNYALFCSTEKNNLQCVAVQLISIVEVETTRSNNCRQITAYMLLWIMNISNYCKLFILIDCV